MMLPLRYPTHWRIAGLILLGSVFAAALLPSRLFWPGGLPITEWTHGDDKWVHAITFAVLTIWIGGQYSRRAYWRVAAGLMLFGVLIEGCQGMVGYRTRDAADLIANGAGILAGVVVLLMSLGEWSVGVESWFDRRIKGRFS